MPSEFKFDGNANPPHFTNNADTMYESGSRIRVKVMGVRAEVGQMYGIATIKEVSNQFMDGRTERASRANKFNSGLLGVRTDVTSIANGWFC